MRYIISAALLAVFIAFALRISPEEPSYIPYKFDDGKDAAVRFRGGDGKTMLTGYWNFPNDSNSTNRDEESRRPPPVILLAHGLGGIQGESLNSFVEAFQLSGYAVFTFDYATFGKSDGLPRHQIHPMSHVADIQAAVSMIKGEEGKKRGFDVSRIGLWGTSLGGGHVLMAAAAATAADDPSIRAVISQVPHIASGFESVVMGSLIHNPVHTSKGILLLLLGLVKWIIWKVLKNKIAYYPIVGLPGSAAMMQNPGDERGYLGMLSPASEIDSGWKNSATADSVLHILFYRPLTIVADINLPVFLIAAEHDTLCPAKYVQAAKERIPKAEILTIPNAGHFDVYDGDELQTMLSAQVKFFKAHL